MADPIPIIAARNIGSNTAAWLEAIGIHTLDDVESLGVIEVYRQLVERFPHKVSLNALWALQGALLDIPWNELPPECKEKLKSAVGVL